MVVILVDVVVGGGCSDLCCVRCIFKVFLWSFAEFWSENPSYDCFQDMHAAACVLGSAGCMTFGVWCSWF